MGQRNEELRCGFSDSLTHMAMIRAIFPGDAIVPRKRSVMVEVRMHTKDLKAKVHALLDSGATDNFISNVVVNRFKIPTYKLERPKIIRNVDGTKNTIGNVTHACDLTIQYNGKQNKMQFYIIDLGSDSMILGYPFLAETNPKIDWARNTFPGRVKALSKDAYLWTPKKQKYTEGNYYLEHDDMTPEEEQRKYIPSNERNTLTYLNIWLKRTTKATELAIQVADKKKRTWQEQVPTEYHKFGKVFSETKAQRFPGPRPWDHAIDLKPGAPETLDYIVYPLSPGQQESLNQFLDEHLSKGYIRRSSSPYASPFFFVKKKDGKLRPVQDYRVLNDWTIPNKYPLLLIKELINKLSKKKYFTKFDIRWGYNNIHIKDGDQWKAAFKTNRGLFEPMVMFFGLTNSPATFHTMMDSLFCEELATGNVTIYMDDILIATDGSIDEHCKVVAQVLKKLQDNDLFLKPEKCTFHKKEVEYLGVIVGNNEVKMDPNKVKGIKEWPTLTKVKIAQPLHDLTKKNMPWKWNDIQKQAFQTLKDKF